jgi:hypothetical protein
VKRLVLILFLIPVIGFSQGKLDRAKDNLSSREKTSSSSEDSKKINEGSDDSTFFEDLFLEFFVEIMLYTSYKTALGEFEHRHFSPYPYFYDNVSGEYDFGLEEEDKRSLFHIGGNYLVGNTVNAIEVNVNYRFHPFVGVELSHHSFFEDGVHGEDYLDLTSFMLNYYRIRERSITGWWGIGTTYAGKDVETLGFAYNIGIEFYPVKPMSFHMSFKQSFINESNINLLKLQAKYHRKKMAYYIGYHDISLAGVKVSGVAMGIEFSF